MLRVLRIGSPADTLLRRHSLRSMPKDVVMFLKWDDKYWLSVKLLCEGDGGAVGAEQYCEVMHNILKLPF